MCSFTVYKIASVVVVYQHFHYAIVLLYNGVVQYNAMVHNYPRAYTNENIIEELGL